MNTVMPDDGKSGWRAEPEVLPVASRFDWARGLRNVPGLGLATRGVLWATGHLKKDGTAEEGYWRQQGK